MLVLKLLILNSLKYRKIKGLTFGKHFEILTEKYGQYPEPLLEKCSHSPITTVIAKIKVDSDAPSRLQHRASTVSK